MGNGSRRLLRLVGLVVVLSFAPAALAAATGVRWESAIQVPGTASLNVGGYARVQSISCAGAGNCAAGGHYYDAAEHYEAFVADEKQGVWGSAMEVPGSGALNLGGNADVNSVSCASAGNCAAVGTYRDGSGYDHVFVVDETNGAWGNAIQVPGGATLDFPQVTSVSCGSAGNCAAGGDGLDQQAFVVDETDGVWGKVEMVPGMGALNLGGFAVVDSISCASARNCAAGGAYLDHSGKEQAFVVDERNGVWGKAKEVPGTAGLNAGGVAVVNSVSCASPGNCAAGGWYTGAHGSNRAYVASEKYGVWGRAEKAGAGLVNSVSCASRGNCAAGGFRNAGPFVMSETRGVWGKPVAVVGLPFTGGSSAVVAISCARAGNCAAGGDYTNSDGYDQAFVMAQTNGVWGRAKKAPGTAALGWWAHVTSVSCASAATCAIGGGYGGLPGHFEAFVTAP